MLLTYKPFTNKKILKTKFNLLDDELHKIQHMLLKIFKKLYFKKFSILFIYIFKNYFKSELSFKNDFLISKNNLKVILIDHNFYDFIL